VGAQADRQMNKFKIKVARMETTGRDEQERQVCVTFQLDRRGISFQVPVLLSLKEFDDTEMVQAARNALHRIFVELASQSRKWKLSAKDLKRLSDVSMRLNYDPSGLVEPDGHSEAILSHPDK